MPLIQMLRPLWKTAYVHREQQKYWHDLMSENKHNWHSGERENIKLKYFEH